MTEEFDYLLRRDSHSSPLRGAKSSSVYRGNLVQASEWMLAYTRNEYSQVSPKAKGPPAVEEFVRGALYYLKFNNRKKVFLFRQRGGPFYSSNQSTAKFRRRQ